MKRIQNLQKKFVDLERNIAFQKVISATQIASILGLNQYQTDREIFQNKKRDLPKGYRVKRTIANSKATDHGIKFESKAIDLFLGRHNLDQGFIPPYLATITHPLLGARGDYIFINKNNEPILLEIKCLYTRSITRQIPINYWLQIQTMLYIYDQLGLGIKEAIYCENRFSSETENLLEYWEERVAFNREYFYATVIPSIDVFLKAMSKTPRKRPRSTDSEDERDELDSHSSFDSSYQPFINKRKRYNNRIVTRVNQRNLYSHFLNSTHIHNPQCLKNHLLNNHLVDWLTLYRDVGTNEQYSKTNRDVVYGLLSQILHSDAYNCLSSLHITDVDKKIYPEEGVEKIKEVTKQQFQLLRITETFKALKNDSDIIIGGQLYHPEFRVWAEYDILIKNKFLNKDLDHPNNYLPIKLVNNRFNLTSSTNKIVKMELYLSLTVLNMYFYQNNSFGLVIDKTSNLFWIDYNEEKKFQKWFDKGSEWLKTLTSDGEHWTVDPPNNVMLYPNQKYKNTNNSIQQYKDELAIRNEELTQVWSLGVKQRNKLAESEFKIKSISDLHQHLDKELVRDILGTRYNVIKNIILADQQQNIVNYSGFSQALKKLPLQNEIYLDFEFTDELIYIIGYYIRFIDGSTRFQQFLIPKLNPSYQKEMINAFIEQIKELIGGSKKVTCLHWGQVEQKIIHRVCPELEEWLEFVDLNQMIVQSEVGIPSCYGYGLKTVAKALKQLGAIPTIWKGDTNGLWCNQSISSIANKNPDVNLAECTGIQEILEYNLTDCKVMVDIVDYFKTPF